jgi:hypothetical protein
MLWEALMPLHPAPSNAKASHTTSQSDFLAQVMRAL